MRTNYPLLLATLSLFASTAGAQTLDNGNFSPVVGDNFTQYQAGYMSPGSAGAGQTWNFSSLGTGAAIVSTYQTPAATGHAGSFPGANLASSDGNGNFGFYQTSSSGFDQQGVYAAVVDVTINYQNPERIVSYPCSYNSTWNDNFSSNFTSLGTPITRSGSISGVADGYGTVTMPYGTVSNVLRVKTVESYTDNVNGLYTIVYLYTNYYFYKPGTHCPLLAIYDQVTTTAGSPSTNQLSVWLAGGPNGLNEALRNDIGIEVFPNPATDQASIVFGTEGGSVQLDLIDATGRTVRSEQLAGKAPGIQRQDLDVSALPAGIYQVRITSADGQQGVQRLVVR